MKIKTIEESIKYIKDKKGFSFFFAGMDYVATEEWFMKKDCLRLLSFVNDRRAIKKRCANNCLTFVDSGAFSAMNRKLSIDMDEYIEWLNEYEENLLMYCQWDYIPQNEQTAEECAKKTWDNYLYMKKKLKNPDKLVYCYHYLEDIKWLKQALDNNVKVVALRGLAKRGKNIRYEFLTQVEQVIKKSGKDVLVHAFGMTGFDVLERFKFIDSADSSTWLYTSKFARIDTICLKKVYFGEDLEIPYNYQNLDLLQQMDVDMELNCYGFDAEDMKQRRMRSLYEAKFWQNKMENFER